MTAKGPCSIPASVVITALFATLFLGLLDNQVLSPILTQVARSLQTDVTRVGDTVTLYAIAAGLAGLFIMPYADRRGRARFLKGAVLLFGAASLGAATATHWLGFYGARMLTGLAAGVISAGVISYAADLFPYTQRGRVMGIISSSYFVAPILGIPLAAQVVSRFGWRYVYGLFAVIAAALWLLMRRYLPELIQPPRPLQESTAKTYHDMLADRARRLGVYASFFVSAGTGGFITYLGPWLATEFKLPIQSVASIYLIAGLAALGGALFSGGLADRLGKKKVVLVGNIFSIGLLAWLVTLAYGPLLILALGLTGLAASFRFGPLQALLTELVAAERRSAYIGVRNTISQLGIAASVLIAGQCYKTTAGFSGIVYFSAAMIGIATLFLLQIEEPKSPFPAQAGAAMGTTSIDV